MSSVGTNAHKSHIHWRRSPLLLCLILKGLLWKWWNISSDPAKVWTRSIRKIPLEPSDDWKEMCLTKLSRSCKETHLFLQEMSDLLLLVAVISHSCGMAYQSQASTLQKSGQREVILRVSSVMTIKKSSFETQERCWGYNSVKNPWSSGRCMEKSSGQLI